ncbi:MAG: O-antigen ligase [Clostridiales bacterium]|jgi:O-antigen ligase|nr:O-antigen ligase [Clostridiales bacterium]
MKHKVTKQKKYLFKNYAKKIAHEDEIIIYILMPILALISFAVHATILSDFLYYDKINRLSLVNLYTHIKVYLLALLVGAILCYLLYRTIVYNIMPRLDYITIGLGIIVVISIISTLMSPVQENKWWGSYEKGNGLLAYLVIYMLTYAISQLCISKKNLTYIVVIINFVVIAMCVIGIFQFFGHNIAETKLFETIVTPKGIKLTLTTSKLPFNGTKYFKVESMLQNLNYFGAFCIIYFPFIATLALKQRNIILKSYYYIGVLLTITGLAIAQAFTAVLTLLIIVPLLIVVAVNRKNIIEFVLLCGIGSYIIYKVNSMTLGLALNEVIEFLKKVVANKMGKILIVTAVIFIVVIIIVRPLIKKYVSEIIKISSVLGIIIGIIGFVIVLKTVIPNNKEIFSQRGYIWHYTQDVIKKNPLVGVGPDKFYYEFPQEAENDVYQIDVVIDRPHNMYLQYITDIGFIGLIGFFTVIIGLMWKIADKLKGQNNKEVGTFVTAVLLLLVTYLIQGLANDNMIAIQVMLWPLLAITMSLTNSGVTKEIADKNGTFN